MVKLLHEQERDAQGKQYSRIDFVVVLPVAMPKRVEPDGKCQPDHQHFEICVVDDVDTEQRQT
jgi:hypothetical protein